MGFVNSKKKTLIAITLLVIFFLSLVPTDHVLADENEAIRVYGSDRYSTAMEIANTMADKTGVYNTIVVASGTDFPDALAGSYLAWANHAPILLVSGQKEADLKNYIQLHIKSKGKVFILGGASTVSSEFEKSLKNIGLNVTRLGGKDRYETNLLILKQAKVNQGQEVVICSGKSYADSLSVAAAGRPIMLVGDTFTNEQLKYLRSIKPSKMYIIGGTSAVNEGIYSVANSIATTERIGGNSRYETSLNVANKFFSQRKPQSVVLTSGTNFPDGLSGGPLALSVGAPVLLVTDEAERINAVWEYVKTKGIKNCYALGGTSIISNDLLYEITHGKDTSTPAANLKVITNNAKINEMRKACKITNAELGTANAMLKVMRYWIGATTGSAMQKKIIDIYNSVKPIPVGYVMPYWDSWCDATISAAACVAGCDQLIGRECGVGRHIDIFRNMGIWIEDGTITPKPGDIIIFDWRKASQPNNMPGSHIGIVESVKNGQITTIEGNKDNSCGRRSFKVGWGYIRGYARPRYVKTQNVANAASQAIDQLANAVGGN